MEKGYKFSYLDSYRAVLMIDLILPILLPWFVYRRALSSRFDLGESGKAHLHLE